MELDDTAGPSASSALTCFIIGPIGNRHAADGSPDRLAYEEAISVVEEVIEPACQRVGLDPVRADSLARAGDITEQVFRRLRDDDVVIADLTGANANVMYELGLRHTEDKLTVQIGEYGRLPFDVNVIRTVQFSRSQTGLINARNELTEILKTGLNGDYDAVTATRVWTGSRSIRSAIEEVVEDNVRDEQAPPREAAEKPSDDRGFVDIVAEAEEQQEEMNARTVAINEHIVALGSLAKSSSAEINRADASGKGMRGRLQVVTKYASGLDRIAPALEADVDGYVNALARVSDGALELIKRLEEDPSQLQEESGREFATTIRGLAAVARESLGSLAEMVQAIDNNARLSRVLRDPSQRLTGALNRFVEATGVIDEWDRRLQSLGVEPPLQIPEPEHPHDASRSDERERPEKPGTDDNEPSALGEQQADDSPGEEG